MEFSTDCPSGNGTCTVTIPIATCGAAFNICKPAGYEVGGGTDEVLESGSIDDLTSRYQVIGKALLIADPQLLKPHTIRASLEDLLPRGVTLSFTHNDTCVDSTGGWERRLLWKKHKLITWEGDDRPEQSTDWCRFWLEVDTDEVGSEDAEEILNTLIDRSNGLVRGCQMKAVLLLKGCKAPPIDSDYDLLSDTIDIIDTEVNIEIAYSLQFKIGGCIVNPVYCSRCHLAHAWNSVDCSTVQARKLREEQFGTYSTNRGQKKNKNKLVAERSPAMPPAKELPKASPFKKSKKMM
jgi:hypothetical protein